MTPADLFMDLIDLGVRLQVFDDRLVYKAPPRTMTAELIEQLRVRKAEVIALMVRRMCATCGNAAGCDRPVPMPDGGWICQARLNSKLRAQPAADADRRQHQVPSRPAAAQLEPAGQTVMEQVQVGEAGRGCGERVPVHATEGVVWVRCSGRETCDGVCGHDWAEAAP